MKPSPLLVTVKTLVSLAIGGGAGAAMDVIGRAKSSGKIDTRSLLIDIAMGAGLAIAAHYATPPNSPVPPKS